MKVLLLIVQIIVIISTIACERSEKRSDTGLSEGIEKAYQLSQSSDTSKPSKNASPRDDLESLKNKVDVDQDKEQDSEKYRITASVLILRDKPTRASKIITRIFRDESVSLIEKTPVLETIEGKKAHWLRVQMVGGTKGYVFAAFLERIYKDRMSESNSWDIYQWYITENNVRMREKPNVKAKITRVCKAGDSFNVDQRSDKRAQIGPYKDYWYKTSLGWVFGAFITKDIARIKLPYIKSVPRSYQSLVGGYVEDPWAEHCVTSMSITNQTFSFSDLDISYVYYITDLKKLTKYKYKIKTKFLPIIDSEEDNKKKVYNFLLTFEPKKKRILLDGVPFYRWYFKVPKIYDQLTGSDWQGDGWKALFSKYSFILENGHSSQHYGIIDVKKLSERVIHIEVVKIYTDKEMDYDEVLNVIITVAKGSNSIEIGGSPLGNKVLKLKKVKQSAGRVNR